MRVFLFGVDGFTFSILNPYMDRGLLPNFQRVRDRGAQGILKSTIPPVTPPAWMSISTGLSPANHGIFDFWHYQQTEKGPDLSVATHRQGGKAIWNILSENGKRVIVANVPMTYPPEPVNGIIVSGMMTPSMDNNMTYPSAFKEELLAAVPDYQIDIRPSVDARQIGSVFTEVLKMTQGRITMLRQLLNKPWDFFFLVFIGGDRIQHSNWDDIMNFHPYAVAYYQMVDEALGMVLSTLEEDDLLMIVSDHGFQGATRSFYIHEYLYKLGHISMKDSKAYRRAKSLDLIKDRIRGFIWALGLRGLPTLLRQQPYKLKILHALVEDSHANRRVPDFDWDKTNAWVQSISGGIAGYADILVDNSLTQEEFDELKTSLQEVKDPLNGHKLCAQVHCKDVFGDGPFLPRERHLLVIANDGISLKSDLGSHTLWKSSKPKGIHHVDGIFYLYGKNVKQGVTIPPAHVYDVVPTILSFLGTPLPKKLEGTVIENAFKNMTPVVFKSDGSSVLVQKMKKLSLD